MKCSFESEFQKVILQQEGKMLLFVVLVSFAETNQYFSVSRSYDGQTTICFRYKIANGNDFFAHLKLDLFEWSRMLYSIHVRYQCIIVYHCT